MFYDFERELNNGRSLREIFDEHGLHSYGDVLAVWPTFVEDMERRTRLHIERLVAEYDRDHPPGSQPPLPPKDWSRDFHAEAAAKLPPKDWTKAMSPTTQVLPMKDWTRASAPSAPLPPKDWGAQHQPQPIKPLPERSRDRSREP